MITDKSNQSHLPYQGTGRERKGGKEKFTTNVRLGKLSWCSALSSLDTGHRPCCCVWGHLWCAWGRGNSCGNIQIGSVQPRQVSLLCFQLWQSFSLCGLWSTDVLWNTSHGPANVSEKKCLKVTTAHAQVWKQPGSTSWYKTAGRCFLKGQQGFLDIG